MFLQYLGIIQSLFRASGSMSASLKNGKAEKLLGSRSRRNGGNGLSEVPHRVLYPNAHGNGIEFFFEKMSASRTQPL